MRRETKLVSTQDVSSGQAGVVQLAAVELQADDGEHEDGEEEEQADLEQRNHGLHDGLQNNLQAWGHTHTHTQTHIHTLDSNAYIRDVKVPLADIVPQCVLCVCTCVLCVCVQVSVLLTGDPRHQFERPQDSDCPQGAQVHWNVHMSPRSGQDAVDTQTHTHIHTHIHAHTHIHTHIHGHTHSCTLYVYHICTLGIDPM